MKKFFASLGLLLIAFLMLPTQAFAESTETPSPAPAATEEAKANSSDTVTGVINELKRNQIVEFGEAKFSNTEKLEERFFHSDIHVFKINQSDVQMDNQDFVKAVGLEAGDLFDSSSLLLMVVDNNDGKDKIYAMSSSDSYMEYAIETLGAESEDAGWTIAVNADALEDYSSSNWIAMIGLMMLAFILIYSIVALFSY